MPEGLIICQRDEGELPGNGEHQLKQAFKVQRPRTQPSVKQWAQRVLKIVHNGAQNISWAA